MNIWTRHNIIIWTLGTVVFVLAFWFLSMAASAQQLNQPKTIRLFNNQTKETVGTVTLSGNRAYFRDRNGEHFATQIQNADGTRTLYDPNGKVIEKESLNLPKLPE